MYASTALPNASRDAARSSTARSSSAAAPPRPPAPPAVEDKEKTLDELKARIAWTIDYVSSFDVKALEGSDARRIVIETPQDFDFEMTGLQFLKDWALPHFFFHVTTAYDILRHKGVVIGKQDFVGHAAAFIRPKSAA